VRQIIISPTFVFAVFFIYIGTALMSVPLHYRVRRRLRGANVQVRWSAFSNAIETWRMYQSYRDEAATRGWQLWPYYLHVGLVVETVIFVLVALAFLFVRT
jgi:hypothetical protein